jgi:hypothetical protein
MIPQYPEEKMPSQDEVMQPIVLNLAPLPRDVAGPFMILGLDKCADPEAIEAAWAQRVISARKNQLLYSLEDVNWAREILRDPGKRLSADVAGLNLDIDQLCLREIVKRFSDSDHSRLQPVDLARPPASPYPPPLAEMEEIRNSITLPALEWEAPFVGKIWEELIQVPVDPWKIGNETEK